MSNCIPLIHVVVITYPWHNPDAALIFLLAMRAKITGLLQHCNTCHREIVNPSKYKAKLRDLIAATGLIILLKLDSIVDFSARVTLKFDG